MCVLAIGGQLASLHDKLESHELLYQFFSCLASFAVYLQDPADFVPTLNTYLCFKVKTFTMPITKEPEDSFVGVLDAAEAYLSKRSELEAILRKVTPQALIFHLLTWSSMHDCTGSYIIVSMQNNVRCTQVAGCVRLRRHYIEARPACTEAGS